MKTEVDSNDSTEYEPHYKPSTGMFYFSYDAIVCFIYCTTQCCLIKGTLDFSSMHNIVIMWFTYTKISRSQWEIMLCEVLSVLPLLCNVCISVSSL